VNKLPELKHFKARRLTEESEFFYSIDENPKLSDANRDIDNTWEIIPL
jgi:hypothetical protein